MKHTLLSLGLALALVLPVLGQSTTSTVSFSLKTAAGNAQTRALTIEAVTDPDDDGANIFWGWGATNTFYPTNGVVVVELEPNDYQVTMASTPGVMSITVPTNGMSYNAADLATNLDWYLTASNGPATVVFPLLTMTGGAQTKSLTLAPLLNPVRNGTNIVWGPALLAYPTNGLATTHLEPNGYQVTMSGGKGALTIYVPTDGGTYNAAALPSVMPTNATAPGGFSWAPASSVVGWKTNGASSYAYGDLATFQSTATCEAITYLSLPANVTTVENPALLSALIGVINDEGSVASFDVSGCSSLRSLSFGSSALTWLGLTGCTALELLTTEGSPVTNLVGFASCTNVTYADVSGGALSSAQVNAILEGLSAAGKSNGYVKLSGQLPSGAPPTGDGTTAAATLGARGWSVLTD